MTNTKSIGKILRIDLDSQQVHIHRPRKAWIQRVIGGRLATTDLLYDELDRECAALAPENMLIFGVGPLTGSLLPASAYYTVTARSPMTGILGDSAAGGQFGPELKITGFDQVIITGSSEKLLYLLITNDGVEFRPCPELGGKPVAISTHNIRKAQRDYSIQVAAIGPAGEKLVNYATIVSSGNRVNGRSGMGAVMGSKNIKAVAVRGSGAVEVADTLSFVEEVRKIEHTILNHEEYKKRHQLGTTMLMRDLNGIGILPTRHFLDGVCDNVDEISGERLAEKYKVKNKSCFNCNLHCSRYYICQEHEAEGPEFETLCSFSSRLGCSDLAFALEMNTWLNQMGLDSISTSEVIGWIIECQEKGLISPSDMDGLTLRWGDIESIRNIVQKITFRQGVGDRLAQGATRLSGQFSHDAQKLVMQVKGLDIICGDPRGIKAYGLTYAIASRGADHLRAEPYFELTNRKEEAKQRFGTEKAAMRMEEEGKAALVTYSERIALLTDSLTMCKNIGLCMDVLNLENASSLLRTGTGINYTPDSLQKTLSDSVNQQFRLNRELGMTRDQDTLPERFLKEPLTRGLTAGSVVDIDRMVDEYYRLHDWED